MSSARGFLLVVALLTVAVSALDSSPVTCIPWSSLTSVTFTEGKTTENRRRTTNIPKLNCVGNCPSDARLLSAQCQQTGVSDDGTPSWKCYPKFAPSRLHYSFSTVRVECEGCTRKGDDQLISKSCALYYSVQTDRGVMRHGRDHMPGQDNSLSILLMVCLVMFVILVAKKIFCSPSYAYGPGVASGYPVGGAPYPGGGYGYGYGGGGSGFGTGMLTGFLVGDAIGTMHSSHYHGGGGGYYSGGYDEGGYSGGGGGWGDGAAYGGSDSV